MNKPEKILSTTDFVLWLQSDEGTKPVAESVFNELGVVRKYAHLMQERLELGMFTPCVDGKPIKEKVPTMSLMHDDKKDAPVIKKHKDQYQQALEQVLFRGCEIVEHWKGTSNWITNLAHESSQLIAHTNEGLKGEFVWHRKIIEDLTSIGIKPTEAFWKKVGL